MTSLRDYQLDLKDKVYRNIQSGINRNIVKLQTGGGKSVLFSSIVNDAIYSGGHAVLAVRRRELIKQASGHMDKWKIPHGVHMANHHRYRPNERVQICSIDTLDARDLYPHLDKKNKVIIIDECHDATPKARKYSKFMDSYIGSPTIGFSATPFGDNSLWEAIVSGIEGYELRDMGYLVPERTFVPNIIDVSKVSITRGEFNESELFEASSSKEIIGDFVRDWKLYAQGRPTILFAVNVEHSKIIADAFNEAGIRAVHSDASTRSSDRESAIRKLISGEISVLTNVNIFSTGVDIPSVSAIQICRPTQSLIWHLQAIGRGLRTSVNTGKENCIIIDNAGNTLRHGTAYKVRDAELGKPKRRGNSEEDEESVGIRRCKRCHFIYEPKFKACPDCGFVNPKIERKPNQKEGDLIEYQISEDEKEALIKKSFVNDYWKLDTVAHRNAKIFDKKSFVWNQLSKKYPLTTCKRYGHIVGLEF